jgi:hypothetical protein
VKREDFPSPKPFAFRRIPNKKNYLKDDSKSYYIFEEFFTTGDKFKGFTEMVKCYPEGDKRNFYYIELTEFDPKDYK